MKLVSFAVKTPFGPVRRIGAAMGAEVNESSQFVDLNTGYGLLLRDSGEARWQEHANVLMPPDMQAFLEGGADSMQRARQVIDFAPNTRADEDYQLLFPRSQVRLLAPV